MTLQKGKEIQACFEHVESVLGAFITFPCLADPIPIIPQTNCDGRFWYSLEIPCELANGTTDFTITDAGQNLVLSGIANIQ